MLANEKLYEIKVPNNIVLNPKDGYTQLQIKMRKLKVEKVDRDRKMRYTILEN